MRARGAVRLPRTRALFLDAEQRARDRTREGRIDTDGAKHCVHLALHLAVTRTQHARARCASQVPEVVALGL